MRKIFMEITHSEKALTLEINKEHTDFLVSILNTEESKLRNNLIHLKRKEEYTENGKEITWWSGGCKVQAHYAAELMYNTLERLAMIESLINQLENNKSN
jgi:hypothetical protein